MLSRADADRLFFRRFSWALILLIVMGFGGRALTSREELPPAPGILYPHIGCIAGWYLLFAVQVSLIAARRKGVHRGLGYLSLPLAIGVLWTGVAVAFANYRLKHDAPLVFFNLLNLSQFAALYAAAVVLVRRPATHKRLMLFGSIVMMPPALVRIIQAIGLPEVATVALMLGLLLPVVVHDRATLGRVHTSTWVGSGTVVAGIVIGGPLAFQPGWAAWLASAVGA